MSYGVNDMRDRVNLSRVQVTRPLVMPTEVINLPNLTGYLRFGRDLPVIRFRDRYRHAQTTQPGFVDRTAEPIRITQSNDDQPAQAELPLPEPCTFDPPAKPEQTAIPIDTISPTPTAHPGLIGPRGGEESHGLRQQSRPGKAWTPSKPA